MLGHHKVSANQFINFVIDEGKKKNLFEVNEHWRPQIALCPFCLFSYKVYAKYETFEEDTAYILIKANLTHIASVGNVNDDTDMKSDMDRQKLFWSSVHSKYYEELKDMFHADLTMFGYE